MATESCPGTAVYYAQVMQAKLEWEEFAETLPEDERKVCQQKVKELILKTLRAIKDVSFSGATCSQLQNQTDKLIARSKYSASNFCLLHGQYKEKKATVDKTMNQADEAAKEPLPSSTYKPGVLSPAKSLRQISQDHKEEHGHSDPDLPRRGADLFQSQVVHKIEHFRGKSKALSFEFIAESVKYYNSGTEHKDNELRDAAVSAASHIGMVEAASLVAPQSIPINVALASIHLSGEIANEMLPIAKTRLETLTEIANEQCSKAQDYSCHKAKGDRIKAEEVLLVLEGLKLTSEACHEVHHAIEETIKEACDEVGVTENNLKRVFEKSSEKAAAAGAAGAPMPGFIFH